jgi:hypothetical protein
VLINRYHIHIDTITRKIDVLLDPDIVAKERSRVSMTTGQVYNWWSKCTENR